MTTNRTRKSDNYRSVVTSFIANASMRYVLTVNPVQYMSASAKFALVVDNRSEFLSLMPRPGRRREKLPGSGQPNSAFKTTIHRAIRPHLNIWNHRYSRPVNMYRIGWRMLRSRCMKDVGWQQCTSCLYEDMRGQS